MNSDIFGDLSFSLGVDATKVPEFTADRMAELTHEVLKKAFAGEPQKQEVLPRGARLSVSCPYCGDSTDHRKKRGNVYIKWGVFKCYNGGCEKYTTVLRMLGDFGVENILKEGEATALRLIVQDGMKADRVASRIRSYEMNVDAMTGTDFSKVLIRRSDIMRAAKLWEIWPTSPAGRWLEMRGQTLDTRFAWDNWKKRIFIFNLDKTGEWVFSMQTTLLDRTKATPGPKYKTYRCSEIWNAWLRTTAPEEVHTVDHLSQFFGVLKVNFAAPVTIFEGPMDHFLYPNSVATCGTNFSWPFELDHDRYLQDNDDAGRALAKKVLEGGGRCFMWQRFLEAHGMTNIIKDWNDVVKWEMKHCKPTSPENFFTDSQLDMIFV